MMQQSTHVQLPEFICSSVGELVLGLVQGLTGSGAALCTPPPGNVPGTEPDEGVGRGVPGPVMGARGLVMICLAFSSAATKIQRPQS